MDVFVSWFSLGPVDEDDLQKVFKIVEGDNFAEQLRKGMGSDTRGSAGKN